MSEELRETIKNLQNNPLVKCGSYEFIVDSNITYAEIYILLEFIRSQEQENKKYKEEKRLILKLIILVIVVLGQAFVIGFGVNLIDDLKATANGYESDRNLCRSQLDSLTQELERMQNE